MTLPDDTQMTPPNTLASAARFPAAAPPEPRKALSRIVRLRNWRDGSAATTVAMAGLLPFAIAWHATYLVAIASALVAAALIALTTHLARGVSLSTLAIHPQFAQHPELAYKLRRLVSDRSRRALARGLRRSAASTRPPTRFVICPILRDRVAPVRPELVQIADALEQTTDPDPTSVALIHELLRDGCSPLYNLGVPAEDLQITLRRVRVGLETHPHAPIGVDI